MLVFQNIYHDLNILTVYNLITHSNAHQDIISASDYEGINNESGHQGLMRWTVTAVIIPNMQQYWS